MGVPIGNKRQVSAQPWVIHSIDPRVQAYIAGLASLTIHSDTAMAEWGFGIGGMDGGATGGTAYLVSSEAYRHISTERF